MSYAQISFGRNGGTRTRDPQSPRLVRYRAALRSVFLTRVGGIEPPSSGLEAEVLPLDDTRIRSFGDPGKIRTCIRQIRNLVLFLLSFGTAHPRGCSVLYDPFKGTFASVVFALAISALAVPFARFNADARKLINVFSILTHIAPFGALGMGLNLRLLLTRELFYH